MLLAEALQYFACNGYLHNTQNRKKKKTSVDGLLLISKTRLSRVFAYV